MGVDNAATAQVLARLMRAAAAAGDAGSLSALRRDLPAAGPSTRGLDVEALVDYKPAVVGAIGVPVTAAAREAAAATAASSKMLRRLSWLVCSCATSV